MQNKLKINHTPIGRGVNIIAASLIVAGLSLSSLSATASIPTSDVVKARVYTYQLERENGIQIVYNDLAKQAQKACRVSVRNYATQQRRVKACSVDLLDDFVQSLDDNRVTAYHKQVSAQ